MSGPIFAGSPLHLIGGREPEAYPLHDGSCHSCALSVVNGVRCHELGCPDAWREHARSCRECGSSFWPETRLELECSPCCAAAFAGQECACDGCADDRRDQPDEDAAGRMGRADYDDWGA